MSVSNKSAASSVVYLVTDKLVGDTIISISDISFSAVLIVLLNRVLFYSRSLNVYSTMFLISVDVADSILTGFLNFLDTYLFAEVGAVKLLALGCFVNEF